MLCTDAFAESGDVRAGSIRGQSLKWQPAVSRSAPTVRQTSNTVGVTPVQHTAFPPAEPPYAPPTSRNNSVLSPIPRQPNVINDLEFKCPSPQDKDFFKNVCDLSTDITAKEGEFPKECGVAVGPFEPRCWDTTTFSWKASGLCYRPLYFQQVQLERYGHSAGPILQPVLSGAQFFATIPVLPYAMGVQLPCEYVYPLGYYRPGNCAPWICDPIPLSVRGALFQAGAVTGAAVILP